MTQYVPLIIGLVGLLNFGFGYLAGFLHGRGFVGRKDKRR